MTRYGTLRTWAVVLKLVGFFAVIFAIIGSIIWAFEVEGFWQTLGVIFIGAPDRDLHLDVGDRARSGAQRDRRHRRRGRALVRA